MQVPLIRIEVDLFIGCVGLYEEFTDHDGEFGHVNMQFLYWIAHVGPEMLLQISLVQCMLGKD
jgi:hypothetical protein